MKHTLRNAIYSLCLLFGLAPALAFAQSAPANLPGRSVYGRIGTPGDTGPGQAIPFATLGPQLGVSKDKIVSILDYGNPDITGTVDAGAIIRAAMPQLGPGAVLHFPAGRFLIDSCVNNDGFGMSATAVRDNAISIVGTSSAVWSSGTVFVLGPNFPDACSAIHLAGTSNIFGRQFRHFSIQPYTGVYGAGVGTHAFFIDGTNNDVYFEYHFTIDDVQIGNMKLGQSIKSFAAATNPGGGALNNALIENSILMSVDMKRVGDNIALSHVNTGQLELRGDPGIRFDMISGAANFTVDGGIQANANGGIVVDGGVNPVLFKPELESSVANSLGCMVYFRGATSKIIGGSLMGATVSQNYATGTIYPVCIANAEGVSIGPNNRLATSSAGGVHMSVTSAAVNPSTNGNYCSTSNVVADCNVGNASSTINSPKVNIGTANGTDLLNVAGLATISGFHMPGGTSGTFTLLPPLVAAGQFRFGTGTNIDMLSTGGAGQVLQQSTFGGALTIGTVSTTINGTTCTTGSSCTPATNIAVGTTTVSGGSTATNDLYFNNGGVIGRIASANNAVFVTNGSGVGSLATTLPNVAHGTPTSITLTNGTGLPTSGLTGTLQAAQEPAHTGDVTNSAGSLALALAAGSASVLNSGNLAAARMPNAAWSSFSPTPVCGTATFSVQNAAFNTWGKQTSWSMEITITAIGTCTGGTFAWTLPNTPQTSAGGGGAEIGTAIVPVGCKILAGSTAATCLIQTSLALNSHFTVSGVYQNQ